MVIIVKLLLPLGLVALATSAVAADRTAIGQALPTGKMLTPLAAPGARFDLLVAHGGPLPSYIADGAAAIVVRPDRREMLVLASGFNLYNG